MKHLFTLLLIALLGWTITGMPVQRKTAKAQTKLLQASKDATLIESQEGVLGNSEGTTIFVGRTGQRAESTRRGLIAFDFAGVIPPRSRILTVTLTMNMQFSASGDRSATMNLYRVTRFWKEGTSVAQGGPGVTAQPGDATWIYSVYPTDRWSRPGGDYLEDASATTEVKGPDAAYTWKSTPKLVADVQSWVNSPKTNFGWILIGDESEGATAKAFYSSEEQEKQTLRPQLTVTFKTSK